MNFVNDWIIWNKEIIIEIDAKYSKTTDDACGYNQLNKRILQKSLLK
jgi:hypothetical protein